ncbi:F-box protein CPR1-like [Mercurialis annua]|uniref:F-box protein CPR1-like n=1 Tax=Mercurialis annua TaxID=3986 RepID=UPI00215E3A98|nr:F-box protein CPR1-like [Mercurialis annua]
MVKHLAEEIVIEILRKLPAKSLIRFTTVCKSWNSVIKSSNFIATHLHTHHSPHQILLFPSSYIATAKPYHSLHFDLSNPNHPIQRLIPLRFPFDSGDCFRLVGSCNGLYCLSNTRYPFFVWNPSIDKYFFLPQPSLIPQTKLRVYFLFGFGFDCRMNDYKALRMVSYCSQYDVEKVFHVEIEVYSFNGNSWRTISHLASEKFRANDQIVVSVYANGGLHWIARDQRRRTAVIVFDVGKEVFREIMLPVSLVNAHALELFVMGFREKTIAVVYRDLFCLYESHIWVMKEYGVAESWVKVITVGKPSLGMPFVKGFTNNEKVVVEFGKQIVLVDLKSQQIETLVDENTVEFSSVDAIVESLVLLDE